MSESPKIFHHRLPLLKEPDQQTAAGDLPTHLLIEVIGLEPSRRHQVGVHMLGITALSGSPGDANWPPMGSTDVACRLSILA
ncbi:MULTISPECIES: hypothetical protein [Stenotrophomonas]|jgi:hypothetical protein|uniref:hypothetical protein n=1 Tax=Stenotrophomonas TaxID=40323 RepID=UPI00129C6606|nr:MULTISPECIES: hypothetical protein [Stenotrophomonas]HEL4101786.1 hypothetical protein [Stenotrophomonas maltophilia]